MKWIKYLFLLVGTMMYSQAVSVDDTGNTPTRLVSTLLDNACVQYSNISLSSREAVALFSNNGGNFPIANGVIIRSGIARHSAGKYTGENLSSQLNNNGDRYLEQINNASGQSPLITDVAFLEFDFVPLSSDFNFDFLFASNEYGEWQCVSSDVFAFMLTDLSTGATTNLAVVPGTNHPISVRNIKDAAYNGSCEPDNAQLFGSYQVDDPAASSVNMRGYTTVMNASAQITPGNSYRIRLVIGDSNDANYDSAIFLSAGSFNTNVDLGEDRFFCQGDEDVLKTGLDTNLYTHTWTFNGQVIPGENENFLPVDQIGKYGVRVTRAGSNCLAMDEVVFSSLEVNSPQDLLVCFDAGENYSFDLNQNDVTALGLDGEEYEIKYYATREDLQAYRAIPTNQLSTFKSAGDQTIFIKILNKKTRNFCDAVYGFELLVNDEMAIASPDPLQVCILPNKLAVVDLTAVNSQILQGRDPNLEITYHASLQDAKQGRNATRDPKNFRIPAPVTSREIWVRVEDDLGCFGVTSFMVYLNPPPPVSELEDVEECEYYILPRIEYGNYFTAPGGRGTALFAGDIIDQPGTYYIFNGPDENSCINQSSFEVKLIGKYKIPEKYCGEFAVPSPPAGAFYTAPGGPTGKGTLLPEGTVFNSNVTVYFYAEVNGSKCKDEGFDITIIPLPPVDTPKDMVTCGSYVLPSLNNGQYFTEEGGKGRKLVAGEVITASMDLYIYNDEGPCTNEHSFRIIILPQFENIVACGSYFLPEVEVGGFFPEAMGKGEEIPTGTEILSSGRIYYFAETTTTSNCTDNTYFDILVNPIPPIDDIEDVLLCEGEVYVLPELINGQYFSEPNREGTRIRPGTVITETTTVYINNIEKGCTNEKPLYIEIRSLPEVENFTDIYSCAAYELPVLQHGTYYTGPSRTGSIVPGGTVITSTRTLYIYRAWEDLKTCASERAFTVYIEGVDVGSFKDISVCDSYTLPKLAVGGYYSESGGKGQIYRPGDKITTSQRIYVYAHQGKRFICQDEASFNITISKTPRLEQFKNVESCGNYVLPALTNDDFNVSYYWKPGGEEEITHKNIAVPGDYKVYVYATAKNNASCIDEKSFNVRVYPLLDLFIAEDAVCRDPETGEVTAPATLRSGLDSQLFEVNWYFENRLVHTGPDLITRVPGEYRVETVKLIPEKGAACNYRPTTVRVRESSQPVIKLNVSQPFENVATINVEIANGYGGYEYSLDNGEFQESNTFYDVDSGTHTVRVRGLVGNCGISTAKVEVLKFPKFFTPNDDGYNDTWNIPDLRFHPEAETYIYDRYGKILAIIKPNGAGWNGMFNGREMPSNDYWFRVVFQQDGEPKEFKSHFSLIRR